MYGWVPYVVFDGMFFLPDGELLWWFMFCSKLSFLCNAEEFQQIKYDPLTFIDLWWLLFGELKPSRCMLFMPVANKLHVHHCRVHPSPMQGWSKRSPGFVWWFSPSALCGGSVGCGVVFGENLVEVLQGAEGQAGWGWVRSRFRWLKSLPDSRRWNIFKLGKSEVWRWFEPINMVVHRVVLGQSGLPIGNVKRRKT